MQDPIQGPQSTSREDSVERAAVVQPVCNEGMHDGGGCRWSKRTSDSAELIYISDIHLFLVQSKANVLALTETWLTSDSEAAMVILGFSFVHRSRNGATGGGVGFFIKNDIVFEQVEDSWADATHYSFECMLIKPLQTNGKDRCCISASRFSFRPVQ